MRRKSTTRLRQKRYKACPTRRRLARKVSLWVLVLLSHTAVAEVQLSHRPPGKNPGVRSGDLAACSNPADQRWGEPIEYPFRSAGSVDYGLILGGTAAAIAFQLIAPLPNYRRGGFGPDEAIRDALLPRDLQRQLLARDISDAGITLLVTQPFVDALVVAGWYRRSPELAQRMVLINAETIAITAALQGLVKFTVSRERPYGRECVGRLPGGSEDCYSSDRFRSFPSGHAAQGFASAALTCGYHQHFPLYGGGTADTLACLGAIATASATGALRIVGDRHYFSDVVGGAVLGAGVGLLVPWLLHYRVRERRAGGVYLVPQRDGLAVGGAF